MKKIVLVIVLSLASTMLYAQGVGLARGARNLIRLPRVPVVRPHIPPVNPGGRNPFAINPAIGGVLVNALDTNRTMQRVRTSGPIGNLNPVHLPTPTPLVNPSFESAYRFDCASPAKSVKRPWTINRSRETDSLELGRLLERFLRYVRIDTQSSNDLDPETFVLSEGQKHLALMVYNELKAMPGIEVYLSSDFYVFAKLQANVEGVPAVGFCSHFDTAPDCPGGDVHPLVHQYAGGDIVLPNGVTLSPKMPQCAHLNSLIGHVLVTSDGTSLLGADDKAGIAVIMSVLYELSHNPHIPHGTVYACFTHLEEVGKAGVKFQKAIFGDDLKSLILYDLDGGDAGEMSSANFTARNVEVLFEGNLVHPSEGKRNGYADARAAYAKFIGSLPPEHHPGASEGMEGYIHAFAVEALPNGHDFVAKLRIRYFAQKDSAMYDRFLHEAIRQAKEAYPRVGITVTQDFMQYMNVENTMHALTVPVALRAAKAIDMPLKAKPLRAGSTLALIAAQSDMVGGSVMYAGMNAEHSVLEFVSMNELVQIKRLCMKMIEIIANTNKEG